MKRLLIQALFGVCIFAGVLYYIRNNEPKQQNSSENTVYQNQTTTLSESPEKLLTRKISFDDKKKAINALYAGLQGGVEFLDPKFAFPEAALSIDEQTGRTNLEARGLDLKTFEDENLKVDGSYPTVSILASGETTIMETGDLQFSIFAIQTIFLSNSSPIKDDQMITRLAEKGIVIPQVSQDQPLSYKLEITSVGPIILTSNTPSQYFNFVALTDDN